MVDLAVVTGSQNNVSRAMQSGTVTIGVDAGHVPEIIDSTANQSDAAKKNKSSIIFDIATSCFSENALLFQSGRIGVILRSGSLGTIVCFNLVQNGMVQTAFYGVGGDWHTQSVEDKGC
ncbi:MAG: hypothetical protein OXC02_07860 [Rhodobacteraceae bacterium]|nr:hypothetical protein [Paracoccaceae bacterium]